ncbi:hypothetical protein KW785_00710 [Candidatus Parcubacteria bacterium]|nr:hypothetical protein [Candidatus Parcubacteria bacterium]
MHFLAEHFDEMRYGAVAFMAWLLLKNWMFGPPSEDPNMPELPHVDVEAKRLYAFSKQSHAPANKD